MDSKFKNGFVTEYEKGYSQKRLKNIKNPIIIQGFPGIGNIGKMTVDYLIEKNKAKKIMSIYSSYIANTVIIDKDNLIKMLAIKIYHTEINKKNFLFISGDTQPLNKYYSYLTAENIVNIVKETEPQLIMTLGGIGLTNAVDDARVFITTTDKKYLKEFDTFIIHEPKANKSGKKSAKPKKKTKKKLTKNNLNVSLFGYVGPIIGLTGLVTAISGLYNIPNVVLLTETLSDPFHFGINESKKILSLLSEKYNLNVNLKTYEKEFKDKLGIKKIPSSRETKNNIMPLPPQPKFNETSYIG